MSDELDRRRAADLKDLRDHWQTAYQIDWDGQRFTAAWRHTLESVPLVAETAAGLRELIRADYQERMNPPSQTDASRRPGPPWPL